MYNSVVVPFVWSESWLTTATIEATCSLHCQQLVVAWPRVSNVLPSSEYAYTEYVGMNRRNRCGPSLRKSERDIILFTELVLIEPAVP